MKKKQDFTDTNYDFYSEDYKLEAVWQETINNIESTSRWLYLGASASDRSFAKIGITMGDLSSRSYSSGNPDYHLFCAFKCKFNISRERLSYIENEILIKFDSIYTYNNGLTKRISHFESGEKSECYRNIDFNDFFIRLHDEIYENYRNDFVICGMDDGMGGTWGEFVDCIFNDKYKNHMFYCRMLLKY